MMDTWKQADIFLEDIDETFVCSVCWGILNRPVQCKEGHVYCESCFHNWLLNNSESCPACRTKTTVATLSRSRPLENLISKLQVRCIHGEVPPAHTAKRTKVNKISEFCNWKGNYSAMANHLKNDCVFELVPCPNNNYGCKMKLQRDARSEHKLLCPAVCTHCKHVFQVNSMQNHIAGCDMVKISCPNTNCEHRCLRKYMIQHDTVCEWKLLECPFHAHGCNINDKGEVTRKKMPQHLLDEANAHSLLLVAEVSQLKMKILTAEHNLSKVAGLVGTSIADFVCYVEWLPFRLITNSTRLPQFTKPTRKGAYQCYVELELDADENITLLLYIQNGPHFPVLLGGTVVSLCGFKDTYPSSYTLDNEEEAYESIFPIRDAISASINGYLKVEVTLEMQFRD